MSMIFEKYGNSVAYVSEDSLAGAMFWEDFVSYLTELYDTGELKDDNIQFLQEIEVIEITDPLIITKDQHGKILWLKNFAANLKSVIKYSVKLEVEDNLVECLENLQRRLEALIRKFESARVEEEIPQEA